MHLMNHLIAAMIALSMGATPVVLLACQLIRCGAVGSYPGTARSHACHEPATASEGAQLNALPTGCSHTAVTVVSVSAGSTTADSQIGLPVSFAASPVSVVAPPASRRVPDHATSSGPFTGSPLLTSLRV